MTVTNHLIDGLPRTARLRLLERSERVDLAFGEVLFEPARPMTHVYFPLTGFVSLVTTIGQHKPLEMGLIGNEGVLGATLVLDVSDAPLRSVVQGPGSALRLSVTQLRRELRHGDALPRVLKRYLYVLLMQLSQATACLQFHQVDVRLARWLLMTHDRAHADHFYLTHAFLADMLGVRRSAVTIAAGELQRNKLIRYTRGQITVLSRRGLERKSCACYAAVTATYNQWLA